ncbi:MAG TPA: helix-turn-helix domain-containing protein, partial [Myxococcaceae bacterium]|nr:helix-turn-helix domain-containing protein [Myxococcaceae bacterium]
DLEAQVAKGDFREDLFFRLNGISIEVPPLRKRVSEIPTLAAEFAREASRASGLPPRPISPEAMERLRQYRWPGNIRELRNLIERAVALSADSIIEAKDLPLDKMVSGQPANVRGEGGSPSQPAEHPERKRILETLDRCGWNQSRAAAELKMSRQTLSARLEKYDIPRPRKLRKV